MAFSFSTYDEIKQEQGKKLLRLQLDTKVDSTYAYNLKMILRRQIHNSHSLERLEHLRNIINCLSSIHDELNLSLNLNLNLEDVPQFAINEKNYQEQIEKIKTCTDSAGMISKQDKARMETLLIRVSIGLVVPCFLIITLIPFLCPPTTLALGVFFLTLFFMFATPIVLFGVIQPILNYYSDASSRELNKFTHDISKYDNFSSAPFAVPVTTLG